MQKNTQKKRDELLKKDIPWISAIFEIEWLFEKFLFYLQYEKNSSPKTLENYSLWINRFISYVGNIDVREIKMMYFLDYRMYLNSIGLSPKTINYHIVALRSFFKFLLKNDIDCISPDKLELSKNWAREVSYLEEEEIMKIMKQPVLREKNNELKRLRDETILWFLYGTWVRVSELLSLTRTHIKPWTNQMAVIGKWSKSRPIFMTKKAEEKLIEYLDIRIDDSPWLFISLSGNSFWNKLSRNSVEELVRKYKNFAGIEKKVTPHTLRHSFATTLLRRWADIRSVQSLLGHSSITTTQIYTHIDDKHLKSVHDLLDDL